VRRLSLQSLLGPALVLYLVADAAASSPGARRGALAAGAGIDGIGIVVALLAVTLTLAQRLLVHDAAAVGARALGWLGLFVAIGLVRAIAPRAMSLPGDVAHALALSAASALLVHLLSLMREPGATLSLRARLMPWLVLVGSAGAGLVAVLPPLRAGAHVLVVPAEWSHAPLAVLAGCIGASVVVRLRRLRKGSPSVQAAQAWVLLGLVPTAVSLALVALAQLAILPWPVARCAVALCAWLLVWGHGAALDPDRRLHAGPAARAAASFALVLGSVVLAAHLAAIFFGYWMTDAPILLVIAVSICMAELLRAPATRLATRWLAPARGRLLEAVASAHDKLSHATRIEGVAQIVLQALGEAVVEPSADGILPPEARAILYRLTPPSEMRLDAAGVAHAREHTLHPEIERVLRARPGETLVRASLEAKIVREPPLRPLIAALVDLDALCVVPLIHDADLEGVLVVPRARRKRALALEELVALEGLARHVAAFLAVLASDARAQLRAEDARREALTAREQNERATEALGRVRHELSALHALPRHDALELKPIAYSAAMRSMLSELEACAGSGEPLWLHGEHGVAIDPLARHVHERSPRAGGPLVVIACANASVTLEQALAASHEGTLLLLDIAALAPDVQRALVQALSGPKPPRIVASARFAPEALVQAGALLPELAQAFTRIASAPALRARKDDLPSLTLLALDRAGRVLGKPTVGIDGAAQARLIAHDWPGNALELQAVVERAVLFCEAARIDVAIITRALGHSERAARDELALDGTYERIERRVLKRALERTSGNKSEAARLLGLPRTTFVDKLRRHSLDERDRSGSGSPPSLQ
jgi:DNA-binding NtrC family response regulator